MSKVVVTNQSLQKNEAHNRISGRTRLQGRRLKAARILYFTLFCLMIGLFLQGILANSRSRLRARLGRVTPTRQAE
jgi:cytochrome b561